MLITHKRVATQVDSGNDKISSSAWNDTHALSGASNALAGFDASGHGLDVTVGSGLAYAAGILSNAAAGGYSISTKTAGYTETATAGIVVAICNLAAGFTVTLPTAVSNGAMLVYKKALAAGQIIVAGSSGQTIDGGSTATLNNLNESITLISDGSNWQVI